MDSPASHPERADAEAPASHHATPARRRRLLARLGERSAQLAYIGLWAGLFILAGVVSVGATFVPFVHRAKPPPPPAEPASTPPPQRILGDGLLLPVKVVGAEIHFDVNGTFRPPSRPASTSDRASPAKSPGPSSRPAPTTASGSGRLGGSAPGHG